ncbi:S-layer homology domain-containing protein [Intestinibacillus massiliensis]|nr:S-layer homology domain-containing protein [Intestinibacillus massiliensis]
MKNLKRFLSGVLAGALLLAASPMALAASDIENHWSKSYIEYMSKLGVMKASSDGTYKPDQAISRAEFMRYLNRAFHFTDKANISFSDVTDTSAWYYEPVQVAVAHGYINGMGDNKMAPLGNLTREQAATIIGRLHKYTPTASASSLTFTDKNKIQSYSAGYIAEAVDKGYIVGYPDGSFKPQELITRAQMAKILYAYMGTSLDQKDASYTGKDLRSDTDNVTICEPATLSDAEIDGDLYITEGVLSGTVELRDVKVKGKIVVSGGDVVLDGVDAPEMVVSTPLSNVLSINATGETNIGKTEIQSAAALRESGLDVSAGGFSDLVVTGDQKPAITLDGEVWDVKVQGDCSMNTTSNSSINTLTADAAITVTGYGSIQKAVINKKGVSLSVEPSSYELASGVSAEIAGEEVSSSNAVTVTPATVTVDAANSSSSDSYSDFTISSDPQTITKLVCEDKNLKEGTDYRVTDKGFRLYKTYTTKLKEGNHVITVYFEDGTKGSFTVKVVNSAKNSVDTGELHFNKYHESLEYANLTVTLSLASGVTLNSIKISGTTLERGTDYTYNTASGVVVLQRTALEKKSTGSYTVTFNVSKGNNPTLSLTVEDSSPKNEIAPTSVDFDANSSSGGYQDIRVELTAVDGATLKSVSSGGKTLTQDWQYKLDGKDVVLNKSNIDDFAEKGAAYCDFTFNMSKGENPVLRVNFVTTYAIKVNVVDDLGNAIEGAKVEIIPTGDSAVDGGTPAQKVESNSEGLATAYVKRGTYTVTAESDKFQSKLTRTITVNSSGQTVKMTAEILENVKIYVTSTTGAKISGATVTLGSQTVTTGADGLAEFNIKRQSYTLRVTCSGYQSYTESFLVEQETQKRVQIKKV